MRRIALCVAWLVGCGASASLHAPTATTSDNRGRVATSPRPEEHPSAVPPTAPPPPPALPVSRTDPTSIPSDPALASAAALYGQLVASPISLVTPSPDTATGIQEVIANIQAASAIATDIGRACAPIESPRGASQVAALLLHADAYDLLASRVVHATLPVPDDLARQLAPASPDVRAEIEHQYHDRIAAALVDQVRPVHCMAAVLYRRVLTIDSTNARAIAQLAAYGDAFVRSCD